MSIDRTILDALDAYGVQCEAAGAPKSKDAERCAVQRAVETRHAPSEITDRLIRAAVDASGAKPAAKDAVAEAPVSKARKPGKGSK